jgi:serine/threonine protein kinase
MSYPPKTEIVAAAQDPQFIKDPFLHGSSMILLGNGRPSMFGGGFSQVFQMEKTLERWAFKVWTYEIENNAQRYEMIKAYLQQIHLPYFVDFEYVLGGLLVDGIRLDTLRMLWIDGQSLLHYINYHLVDEQVLKKLAAQFLKMTQDLHENQISHGDLQHENIFVSTDGTIKLIDYDSICIPSLEGSKDVCRGKLGYQHPARLTAGYLASVKVDHFSELVIYLSILAVAENPVLWGKYKVMEADYRLLFRQEDFLDFRNSAIRYDLMMLSDEIQALVEKLDSYLAAHLLLPSLAS